MQFDWPTALVAITLIIVVGIMTLFVIAFIAMSKKKDDDEG